MGGEGVGEGQVGEWVDLCGYVYAVVGEGDEEGGGVEAFVVGGLMQTDLLGCAGEGARTCGSGMLTRDLGRGGLILGGGGWGRLFITGFIMSHPIKPIHMIIIK